MNKQLLLAKRPVGLPDKDTWSYNQSPVPTINDGQILIPVSYTHLTLPTTPYV